MTKKSIRDLIDEMFEQDGVNGHYDSDDEFIEELSVYVEQYQSYMEGALQNKRSKEVERIKRESKVTQMKTCSAKDSSGNFLVCFKCKYSVKDNAFPGKASKSKKCKECIRNLDAASDYGYRDNYILPHTEKEISKVLIEKITKELTPKIKKELTDELNSGRKILKKSTLKKLRGNS